MAHKKKPYVKGLYKIIDKDNGKEIARNLTKNAIDNFPLFQGLDFCEIESYYEIIKQK